MPNTVIHMSRIIGALRLGLYATDTQALVGIQRRQR